MYFHWMSLLQRVISGTLNSGFLYTWTYWNPVDEMPVTICYGDFSSCIGHNFSIRDQLFLDALFT